jgi:hypothetical protein
LPVPAARQRPKRRADHLCKTFSRFDKTRAENNVARFEEAVPILRGAIAVQKKVNSVPGIAFTEDSPCDVLTDLGAARKKKALAQEAIAACQDALVIFRDRKMDDLTVGSEKNLAEAPALLAKLN